jgi:hypothetical protein
MLSGVLRRRKAGARSGRSPKVLCDLRQNVSGIREPRLEAFPTEHGHVALHRQIDVIHEYQSDSSSKRPQPPPSETLK